MHQGASFNEHLACAGVHRRRPLDPRLRGDALQKDFRTLPAGKDKTAGSSCLGGTGPYKVEIGECLRCTSTAYSGITVAAGMWPMQDRT